MYLKHSVLAVLLAASAYGSDKQAYAGVQFRVEQSFLDLVSEEFYYQLPYIVNDVIAPLIPTEIDFVLGFFQVRNIKLSGFEIDTARAKWAIDPQQKGVMMNWAELKKWNIHFECWYVLFWPFEYRFIVDIDMKDANLDNGLAFLADSHTGAPEIDFFNTEFDLGLSSVHFSGDFVIAIIGWLTNFLKYPAQVLVNMFFEPVVNFAINDIIIPVFLSDGLFRIDVFGSDGSKFDTLVLDATLPQAPVFAANDIDVFADGTVYLERHGHRYPTPTTPMRFQLDDRNLQLVLSSYTVNNLIEAVLATGLVSLPVAGELTTFLMLPIIPELYYNFGGRNVTLGITPVSGTKLEFSGDRKTATVHVDTLIDWIVVEDENSQVSDFTSLLETTAFTSLLDLDMELSIQVNATKHLNVTVEALTLNAFNVTKDNLGGSVAADEAGILYRLQGVMAAVEPVVNDILAAYPIQLPEFKLIDYSIRFEYQDGAFGTGLLVTPKGH